MGSEQQMSESKNQENAQARVVQALVKARAAARRMSRLDTSARNHTLEAIGEALSRAGAQIDDANQADLCRAEAENLAAPLRKRLVFDAGKRDEALRGIADVRALPDPIGMIRQARSLDDGLDLHQVTCPIGVIGVIFESRPDALVQISCLGLKSGNAMVLKGGSEAHLTNQALAGVIHDAGVGAGLPEGWLTLLESRTDVATLLDQDGLVDLVIPRGSNAFVRYIMDHTRIPVLGHADGICHVYVDERADPEMAEKIVLDSKTQYVAVCNAVETILIHAALAPGFLKRLAGRLGQAGVTVYGCPRTCAILGCPPVENWQTEYLDYKVSIALVDDLDRAVEHINRYGSHHTDAIVTEDGEAARRFQASVDSAAVFWNCSTRFCDGYRFGLGAEVGISTGKIHARGPVGLDGLTTTQYRLFGHGQIVADYASGKAQFRHRVIDADNCSI